LKDYPDYALTPCSVLLTLLGAESCPDLVSECHLFQNYLYSKPFCPQAFLLTFRLFEAKKELPPCMPSEQRALALSLQKREEAKKCLEQASKSKEAGFIKEHTLQAHRTFDEAESAIKPLLACVPHKESLSILSSYLLSLYAEQIESLERAIISPFAFNELPALITECASSLSSEIQECQAKKDGLFIDRTFLQEASFLATTANLYVLTFKRDFDNLLSAINTYPESMFQISRSGCRGVLFAAKGLYESHKIENACFLLSRLDETMLKDIDYELALEVALEKSLALREMKQTKKAMSLLAWVINSPCASSLRIKAMVVRADIYLGMNRNELAIKQLESVVNKGGEWGAVAERKLRELEKVHGSS
jgi:hypothetical protein